MKNEGTLEKEAYVAGSLFLIAKTNLACCFLNLVDFTCIT